jgi:hypothetical protein
LQADLAQQEHAKQGKLAFLGPDIVGQQVPIGSE